MNQIAVECHDVVFGYEPQVEIIRVPHLRVEPGEVSVFCGGNGTGKTTMMKILGGILQPWAGKIGYTDKERILTSQEGVLQAVYVHQEPYILKGTVFQNLSFFLPGLKREALMDRVHQSLNILGLTGFEKMKASTLSGGEKKRLALARALAAQKQILMLDEPTANVDAKSTNLLIEKLMLLKSQGITIVVATHDEDFSRRIADATYHFSNGSLMAQEENNC